MSTPPMKVLYCLTADVRGRSKDTNSPSWFSPSSLLFHHCGLGKCSTVRTHICCPANIHTHHHLSVCSTRPLGDIRALQCFLHLHYTDWDALAIGSQCPSCADFSFFQSMQKGRGSVKIVDEQRISLKMEWPEKFHNNVVWQSMLWKWCSPMTSTVEVEIACITSWVSKNPVFEVPLGELVTHVLSEMASSHRFHHPLVHWNLT